MIPLLLRIIGGKLLIISGVELGQLLKMMGRIYESPVLLKGFVPLHRGIMIIFRWYDMECRDYSRAMSMLIVKVAGVLAFWQF